MSRLFHPRPDQPPQPVLSPEEQAARAIINRARRSARAARAAAETERTAQIAVLYAQIKPRLIVLVERWLVAAADAGIDQTIAPEVEQDGDSLEVCSLIFPSEEEPGKSPAWDHGYADLRIRIEANSERSVPLIRAEVSARAQLKGYYRNEVTGGDTIYEQEMETLNRESLTAAIGEMELLDPDTVAETLAEVLADISEQARQYCSCGAGGKYEMPDLSTRCRACLRDDVAVALGQIEPEQHREWQSRNF